MDPDALRESDFDAHFLRRRAALVELVERATGKTVQRDVSMGEPEKTLEHFEKENLAVTEELKDWQMNSSPGSERKGDKGTAAVRPSE